MIQSLKISVIAFIIVIFPFFVGKQMESIIRLITINADWFPWYSLNSFNIWWIASGLKGMQVNDKHLVLGIISAKQLGLLLFSFTYFIATVHLFFSKKDQASRHFIESSTLVVFSFFHILTQSHERYLFPAIGLVLIMTMYWAKSNESNVKRKILLFSTYYLLLTTFFFLNLYLSMGWNYPDEVIPKFTREGTIGLSFWISIAQIILFLAFFIWFLFSRSFRYIKVYGAVGVVVVSLIISKNLSFMLKKPISLKVLKPIGIRQDYLGPVNDKTVESARGVKFWNRLSVNYNFYEKGIGSHADSEITYHLNRKFSKFSTDFGVDTEADGSAKVYFSILGDGRELFRSNIKGRFDSPGTTSVDVKGINYLTLKITKAGESNFGAHADWLNPVLIR